MRITRRAFLRLLAASGLRELGGGFADVVEQLDDQVERGEVDGAWLDSTSGSALFDGEIGWVRGTWGERNTQIWVDGVLVVDRSGQVQPDGVFRGEVGEVQVFDRALDGDEIVDVSRETGPPCGAALDHIATLPCSWRPAGYEPCDACLQAGADGWLDLAETRTSVDLAGRIVAIDVADGWERSITVGRFVPVKAKNEIGVECSIDMGIVWAHLRAIDQDGGEWVTADKGETWTRVL